MRNGILVAIAVCFVAIVAIAVLLVAIVTYGRTQATLSEGPGYIPAGQVSRSP